ncbi:MAG: hypothetical protein FDZ69_12910 [Deltaproteobacteria bacterium]|nr:MAG: hypothetical protein FDZ69_12910 [Deltaproteobacteria bacterium]
MTEPIGLRRIRRTLMIHRITQVVLIVLLLYMAILFQQRFQQKYDSLKPFFNSVVLAVLIQVAVFFPIRKFADNEARRELNAAVKEQMSIDEQKQLRNQRLLGDFIKASVFIFFVAFILILKEQATFVHSTAFFCCIGTFINYLQNYNFAVRRRLSGTAAG